MNVYYSFVASLGEFIISSSWIICFLPFGVEPRCVQYPIFNYFLPGVCFPLLLFLLCTGSGQSENIILLEMALNAVDLPQLPLLLSLKLHVLKSCAGASATSVVVRHRVSDDEFFIAAVYCALFQC